MTGTVPGPMGLSLRVALSSSQGEAMLLRSVGLNKAQHLVGGSDTVKLE